MRCTLYSIAACYLHVCFILFTKMATRWGHKFPAFQSRTVGKFHCMCHKKRWMMCWASIFNGRFSGPIKVLKYVLKKTPVQPFQAIVDSAWSGAARWEQTAWTGFSLLSLKFPIVLPKFISHNIFPSKISQNLKSGHWRPCGRSGLAPLCLTVGSLAFQWQLIQLLSQTASALPQSGRDGSVWFLAQLPLSQAHAFSDHRPLFSPSHNFQKSQ